MITVVGGTFAHLHPGHKKLLRAAVDTGNSVVIGLTTDAYLSENKTYYGRSYSLRKRNLTRFMNTMTGDFEILPLGSKDGNTIIRPDYEAIVVSPETVPRAEHINRERIRAGLNPLKIIKIPYVLAEDLFPISSTRIINGEIDTRGRRVTTIRVSISTRNSLKETAVKSYFSTIMKNFEISRYEKYRLETEQPFGDDTIRMATDRAMAGLTDEDYSIGIESGIFYNRVNNSYMDVHYCTLIDRYGRITTGKSSGFEIPENIMGLVKQDKTISTAAEKAYGVSNVGEKDGIVGVISDGKLKRIDLIREAVRNAFIPRFNPEYYSDPE